MPQASAAVPKVLPEVFYPDAKRVPLRRAIISGLRSFMQKHKLFLWSTPDNGLCGWISLAVSLRVTVHSLLLLVSSQYKLLADAAKDSDTNSNKQFSAREIALSNLASKLHGRTDTASEAGSDVPSELRWYADEWFKPCDGSAVRKEFDRDVLILVALGRGKSITFRAMYFPRDQSRVQQDQVPLEQIDSLPEDAVIVVLGDNEVHCAALLREERFIHVPGTRKRRRSRTSGPGGSPRRSRRQAARAARLGTAVGPIPDGNHALDPDESKYKDLNEKRGHGAASSRCMATLRNELSGLFAKKFARKKTMPAIEQELNRMGSVLEMGTFVATEHDIDYGGMEQFVQDFITKDGGRKFFGEPLGQYHSPHS